MTERKRPMNYPEEIAPKLAETLMETAEKLQACSVVGQVKTSGEARMVWVEVENITNRIIKDIGKLVPHIVEMEEPAYDIGKIALKATKDAYPDMEQMLNEFEYREER